MYRTDLARFYAGQLTPACTVAMIRRWQDRTGRKCGTVRSHRSMKVPGKKAKPRRRVTRYTIVEFLDE